MSRLSARFARLRDDQRKALIPYITAGDPHPDITVPLMHRLVAAGADVLELGVPFSDPIGDGPVIQLACERSLVHGTTLHDVLAMVRRFRETDTDTPVVLMGYLNPVEVFGYAEFTAEAAQAGVDGVLIVDLPPEESSGLLPLLHEHALDPIFLVAPTTTAQRMQRICDVAGGFVYYVSLKGVTGADVADTAEVAARIDAVRSHTGLPVGVGFGISTPEQAAAMSVAADAVVVGSALVRRIEADPSDHARILDEIPALLAAMRAAMDRQMAVTPA